MSNQVKFSEIKEEVDNSINKILLKNFEEKEDIDTSEIQETINKLNEEISKDLQGQFKGFKFIIHSNIFKKSGAINLSAMCCYDPENDGTTNVKFENDNYNVFVGIFAFVKKI